MGLDLRLNALRNREQMLRMGSAISERDGDDWRALASDAIAALSITEAIHAERAADATPDPERARPDALREALDPKRLAEAYWSCQETMGGRPGVPDFEEVVREYNALAALAGEEQTDG